jgi:hypothetical protein
MHRWSRYPIVVLAITSFGLAAAAAINFAVDAEGVYRSGSSVDAYARKYAIRLVGSQRGLAHVPFERPIKLELAKTAPTDCFVTGSSQQMRIRVSTFPAAERFGCTRLVNLSVAGGSWEDFLVAAKHIAERTGPRTLFVGIAPWMLQKEAEPMWVASAKHLPAAQQAFGLTKEPFDDGAMRKALHLINGRYLWQNLVSLRHGRTLIDLPPIQELTGDLISDSRHGGLHTDGSAVYGLDRPQTWGEVRVPERMPGFDPAVVRNFRQVAEVLQRRGVTLSVILAPYHPKVWECRFQAVCDRLRTSEATVREIARDLNIKMIGSYDPRHMKMTGDDFVDYSHLGYSGVKKLDAW